MFLTMTSNLYFRLGQNKLKILMILTLLFSIESSFKKLKNVNKKLTKIAAVGRFFVYLDHFLMAAGRCSEVT